MTKKDMAALLGISINALRRLEAGGPLPKISLHIFLRCHDTFGVPADVMLTSRLLKMQ